jgi:valyl-tRNA synthetase
MNLDPNKVGAYKKFANKIWNATRFVLEKAGDANPAVELIEKDIELYKSWQEKLKDITSDIDNFRLHLASEKIYDYFWKTFCDQIIETHKLRIQNNEDAESAKLLLMKILKENIITLHPFMPFITEELWQYVGDTNNMLMVEPWPIHS